MINMIHLWHFLFQALNFIQHHTSLCYNTQGIPIVINIGKGFQIVCGVPQK